MLQPPTSPDCVRFVPSRVEGDWGNVQEVRISPKEWEILTNNHWVTVSFASIGKRLEPRLVTFLKNLVGRHDCLSVVGERDWCRPPKDRYFLWFTPKPLKTFMPIDEAQNYAGSLFPQIHRVLEQGGYCTFDLA